MAENICKAEFLKFDNTDIAPGNYAPVGEAREGVWISGNVGIQPPGGEVNFNYTLDEARPVAEFRINTDSVLTVGNTASGGTINITGYGPKLLLGTYGTDRNGHLVLDAQGKGADKAVINIFDSARHDNSQQDFYITMGRNSSIDIIEGKLSFIDQHNTNGDEWPSTLIVAGGSIIVHPNGIMDSGVSTICLAGQSTAEKTRLESWGNLLTPYLTVEKNASAIEHADIVIDGHGGTGTTRGGIRLAYGGEYFGNIAVDDKGILEEGYSNLIIHNGTVHGNVKLSNGKISMHDGAIDGNLTVLGGKVELWEKQFTTPPYVNYSKGVIMRGGSLELPGANITSGDNISIANGASAEIGSLLNFSSKLLVGSANDTIGGANLKADNVDLGSSGMLIMDPPWGLAPANAAIETLGSSEASRSALQGKIGVGMNSLLAIGINDLTWLPDVTNRATGGTGLSENGIKSVLGLFKPLQIASGGILRVDGSQSSAQMESSLLQSEPNTVTFANRSMLALNGQDDELKSGVPALAFASPKGEVRVNDGAQIFISQAQPGSLYKVVDSNSNPISYYSANGAEEITPDASSAWEGENLRASSDMIQLTYKGNGIIKADVNNAENVFPALSPELAAILENLYSALPGQPFADPQSPLGGVRFLSRATDNEWNGGAKKGESVSVIESAARMSVVGAIPQMAVAANNAAAKAASSRLGTAGLNAGISSENYADGFGLWIMPLYQGANSFGMEAGNLSHDFSGALGGIAIGGDWNFYNDLRAGLSFNIGGGYARGSGDMQETTNRMNFWGFTIYGGWTPGDFGLFADFGLTSTCNELKQELPEFMGMDDLKSDVTAMALSAGLRAEYSFHAKLADITPHAGIRYHHVHADSHDITSGGREIIDADDFYQNFWTFPVGVSISGNINFENWSFKPVLDFMVIPAAGDIDAKTKIRFTGTGKDASLSTQTMDWVTYGGSAGFELAKDNMSLSVAYSGQFGPHSSAHGVFAAFRYEF